MIQYKQTKQEIYTNEVNKVLTKHGKYLLKYIAPCSIDKKKNISTSVNDYTIFTDRYVDANLITIDPIIHWVENSVRTYVTFEEFSLIDDVKTVINGEAQIINGKKLNKHRADCKIHGGFYYIERSPFHNYLIIFGSKRTNFDIYEDIFSDRKRTKWFHDVRTDLMHLMADMNSVVFTE